MGISTCIPVTMLQLSEACVHDSKDGYDYSTEGQGSQSRVGVGRSMRDGRCWKPDCVQLKMNELFRLIIQCFKVAFAPSNYTGAFQPRLNKPAIHL